MKFRKLFAGILAVGMMLSFLPQPKATSSSELRQQITELENQQSEILAKQAEVQSKQDANWASIEEMISYKSSIDEEVFLLYSQIDNLNEQITAYTTLIAQTQSELDEAQGNLDELTVRYRARIRAMEEEGEVSYWSVLFKANSFTDLLDRLNMIREIAAADQRLMDQMRRVTEEVANTKTQLEGEKESLESSRTELETAKEELDIKRAESDAVLQELNANHRELEALHEEYDDINNALAAEIAAAEKAFNEAKAAEEEAKRREEEEKRRQDELNNGSSSGSGSGNSDSSGGDDSGSSGGSDNGGSSGSSTDSGWLQPCSYVYISSSYGQRSSGWHNGVDFAAYRGTPIYASRSGTVTKAVSLTYSYGNYVTINHGDGYSSLYAHMDYFVVSAGQYVSQGQLIGYVGSTGNSTGNHLHFTIFYNGSDVNPMNYL